MLRRNYEKNRLLFSVFDKLWYFAQMSFVLYKFLTRDRTIIVSIKLIFIKCCKPTDFHDIDSGLALYGSTVVFFFKKVLCLTYYGTITFEIFVNLIKSQKLICIL